jgi:uncharacterized protein (DUF1501 family)
VHITRRNFLHKASLLSLAPVVPAFVSATARAAGTSRDGRKLVVIQLDGGNDGLNTLVPFADENYARLRPVLALNRNSLIRLNDHLGLHPGLRELNGVLEAVRFTVVQGVGYPNPSRSHGRAMAIWHTARFEEEEHLGHGWLGRALDAASGLQGNVASLYVGLEAVPTALRGRASRTSAVSRLDDFSRSPTGDLRTAIAGPAEADDLTLYVRRTLLDGYTTADAFRKASRAREHVRYPSSDLANRLRLIARLLKSGNGARVYYALQSGYDTHGAQLPRHDLLLRTLAGALQAFLADLRGAGLEDRVCVLLFSEFGRRVAENGSAGTDHGAAGPVFLAGPRFRSNLVGDTPSLQDLDDGDLRAGIDFRRVYATVLEDWLGLPARESLAGAFERMRLFR